MGLFSGIKSTYKKSEAAVVVQNLLEHQARVGLFDLDPAKSATNFTQLVWDSKPDVFNGKFGQRPHKIVVAASALANATQLFDRNDLNGDAVVISLGNILSEIEANGLTPYRNTVEEKKSELEEAVEALLSLQNDADQLASLKSDLKDVEFRLEQFDKHGVRAKLEKQVEFGNDLSFCETVDEAVAEWKENLESVIGEAEERFEEITPHESKFNESVFERYTTQLVKLKETIKSAKSVTTSISTLATDLGGLRNELETTRDGLKEEFAEVERELVKALESNGVTSIQPDDYIKLTERKAELNTSVSELKKKTEKHSVKLGEVRRAIASLNDSWHAEFMFIKAELEKINSAQP
jgi:chromosome segregation ATPase